MFEKYSYENRNEAVVGWVPVSLHAAGVPWDKIFDVFDELFTARVSRFTCLAALVSQAHDVGNNERYRHGTSRQPILSSWPISPN
jgi:hypothetical protein